MAANPYERRHWRRGDESDARPLGLDRPFMVPRPPEPAIQTEDLDAMVRSAEARGRAHATHRLVNEHLEQLRDAQRRAWDEGNELGVTEGYSRAITELTRGIRPKLVDGASGASVMVAKFEGEPKRVTKDELAEALKAARGLLYELISTLPER